MKLSFSTFLAAALVVSTAHAKPRVRVSQAKGGKSAKSSPPTSALYTMTNQPDNEVLVFARDVSHGRLTFVQSVSTTGSGSQQETNSGPPANFPVLPGADPVGSQGGIVVAGKCLLVVNAGTNDVSTFNIHSASEIEFAGRFASNGLYTDSIAERDGLVYVLNGGGNGSIQGYTLSQFNCGLNPIGGPVELIQGGGSVSDEVTPSNPPFGIAKPSQIGFTPEGHIIVNIPVPGGGQNFPFVGGQFQVFEIYAGDGSASSPHTTTLERIGSVPFAFDYDHEGRLLVAENVIDGFDPNSANNGGLSVWEIDENRDYNNVGLVSAEQGFTCWIEYIAQNHCVYTANSGTVGSISSFALQDGAYDLVESVAATLNGPLDLIASQDGRFLYTISPGVTDQSGQPHINVYGTGTGCVLNEVQVIEDGFDTQDVVREASDGVFNGVFGLAVYPN